jgi:hypothetical protein
LFLLHRDPELRRHANRTINQLARLVLQKRREGFKLHEVDPKNALKRAFLRLKSSTSKTKSNSSANKSTSLSKKAAILDIIPEPQSSSSFSIAVETKYSSPHVDMSTPDSYSTLSLFDLALQTDEKLHENSMVDEYSVRFNYRLYVRFVNYSICCFIYIEVFYRRFAY